MIYAQRYEIQSCGLKKKKKKTAILKLWPWAFTMVLLLWTRQMQTLLSHWHKLLYWRKGENRLNDTGLFKETPGKGARLDTVRVVAVRQKKRLNKKESLRSLYPIFFFIYYWSLLGFVQPFFFVSCTTFSFRIFTRVSTWLLCLLYFRIAAASGLFDGWTGFIHFLNKHRKVSLLPVL